MLHKPQFYDPAYWSEGFTADAQNILFLPLGCLALSVAVLYAWWTKRLRLRNPVALLCVMTLVLTAATPFTQPRYVFTVYVMLCIELAQPKRLYEAEGVVPPRRGDCGVCCSGDWLGWGRTGYSYLRVSTGSRRAARLAGSVPKMTPTKTEVMRAMTADHQLQGILKGVNRPREIGRARPRSVPIRPPERDRKTASVRN